MKVIKCDAQTSDHAFLHIVVSWQMVGSVQESISNGKFLFCKNFLRIRGSISGINGFGDILALALYDRCVHHLLFCSIGK